MKVNEIIKKLRTEQDMTMEELGKKVSVSQQTIQRYESGQIPNIPYDKIDLLANALGVTKSQLMGWEDLEITPEISSGKLNQILAYYTQLSDLKKEAAIDYLKYLSDNSQKEE